MAFLTKSAVNKTTDRFNYNGQPSISYPKCLCINNTVHKIQGLTLPHITVSLYSQIFATNQSYVAISHVKTWDSLNLLSLNHIAIKTDEKIIKEYQHLHINMTI